MTEKPSPDSDVQHVLRHVVAAIAYRSSRVLKEVPESFPELELGHGVRTPREIVSHMSSVLGYLYAKLTETKRERIRLEDWDTEVERFYAILQSIDESLEAGAMLDIKTRDKILQGPLADTFTHIGQLSMMRRVAGASVPGENFILADVEIGRVGIGQGDPAVPD